MADRVLITGGAGFIGCGLAAELRDSGARVMVADVLHPQVHALAGRPERLPDDIELVPLDVRCSSAWDALLKLTRPDVVVHLAAETGTGQSLREATRHGDVNVVGTTQMLDAFSRAGHTPAHLVLASSAAVYGEGAWELDGEVFHPRVRAHADLVAQRWDPVVGTGGAARYVPSSAGLTPENPTNVYTATKLAQEHICSAWAAAMGSDLSILRFQNVYGVGQSLTNSYTGVLTLFARLAICGADIEVFEDGQIIRDFVYVDDVVSALVAAVSSAPGRRRRVLDVGSGAPSALIDVASAIASAAGSRPPTITGRFHDGDVRAAGCDIEPAVLDLGYAPKWDLTQGVRALVEWTRASLEAEAC